MLLVTAQNVLQLSAQEPCTCIALQTQISTAKAAMQPLFGQAVHTCTGTLAQVHLLFQVKVSSKADGPHQSMDMLLVSYYLM